MPSNRQVTHRYLDGSAIPAVTTITVDVFDEDAQPHLGAGTRDLIVNDVPPTVSLSGDSNVDEGSFYTLTLGLIDDPGNFRGRGIDAVTGVLIDWGDGATEPFTFDEIYSSGIDSHTNHGHAEHKYLDGPENHGITIQLVDNEGTHTVPVSKTVTVDNLAPTLSIDGDSVIVEGSVYNLNLDPVFDPGDDTIEFYIIDWGDGKSSRFKTSSLTQATHRYTSGPSNPTIKVHLEDEDGVHAVATLSLPTIQDVKPVVALSGAPAVNEGALYTLSLGPVFDPGDEKVSKFVINWGDGVIDNFNTDNLEEATHTYTDGLFIRTIRVDLENIDGLHTGAGELTGLEVRNVAPTIALSGESSVVEGDTYTLTLGEITEPGNDTVQQYVVHWDNNDTDVYFVTPFIGTRPDGEFDYPSDGLVDHVYPDGPASPTISVDLVDEDGTHFGSGIHVSTVNNEAPTVELIGGPSANEGSTFTFSLGTIDEPGDDTLIDYTVHWGDGTTEIYGAGVPVTPHKYTDGIANPTITVDLRDEDGTHSGAGVLLLAVNNVVPSIVLDGGLSANEGSSYTLTMGQIIDPGDDTVTSIVVHWGDGRTSNTVPGGSVTHVYSFDYVDGNSAPATITVDLVDEDGTHLERGTKVITVVNVTPPFLNEFDLDDDNDKPGGLGLTLSPFNLWVVDERDDEVYVYSPTTGALIRKFELTANGDSKGITVDANGFWVLDEDEKTVTRYDLNGAFQSSFRVRPRGGHLEGITSDGSSLWIVDKDAGVFRYDFSGKLIQSSSFQLDSDNSHAEGITTDGTSLWVVDRDKDRVFRYSAIDADGVVLDSFSVKPATHPEGITTDGTSIWIVDKDSDRVFRFDIN